MVVAGTLPDHDGIFGDLPCPSPVLLRQFLGAVDHSAGGLWAGGDFDPVDAARIRPATISSLTVKHAGKLIEVTQKLSQAMSGGPLMSQDHAVMGVIHKLSVVRVFRNAEAFS
jgi:hypothetical protein